MAPLLRITLTFMKTSPNHSRISGFLALGALVASSLAALGHEDMSKPVITTETRKGADGKDELYMFIDGVKVHELDITKQALPAVVTPGEPAGFFAAPSDAIVLFDGGGETLKTHWTDTETKQDDTRGSGIASSRSIGCGRNSIPKVTQFFTQ